jgi:hypothetical protein
LPTPVSSRLSPNLLLKAGGLSILAALIANLIARLILGAIVPLDPTFQPFSFGAIAGFTVLFTLIGVGVLALVNRLAAKPLPVYNFIGVAAFVLSILPNIAGSANPSAIPMGGAGENYLTLITFHVVAATTYLATLNIIVRRG